MDLEKYYITSPNVCNPKCTCGVQGYYIKDRHANTSVVDPRSLRQCLSRKKTSVCLLPMKDTRSRATHGWALLSCREGEGAP